MFLINLINSYLPNSYSAFDQMRAVVVTSTSLAIGAAALLLALYWVATRSLERKETIFAMLLTLILLALCIWLSMNGRVLAGAWLLTVLMLLINFWNMAWYGISNSSAAAYIIPILVAITCLGPAAGWVVTLLGCAFVFAIPLLQFMAVIKTIRPFEISILTFDAPVLTLIYLIVAILANAWTLAAAAPLN